MAVIEQDIGDKYAIWNGDSCEVLPTLRDESVHLSIYSPPFVGIYHYSSSDRDLSNCANYDQFFSHYEFIVREVHRVTLPGRMTVVHAQDVPGSNGDIVDFPGDIIRMHKQLGFRYHARFAIWKEPLRVAIRTRSKGLTHRQLCKDSSFSNNAGADYLLVFKKPGENRTPIVHDRGLTKYVGEREVPAGLIEKYRDWKDPQTNKLAHWIWQQYASSFWDDIRIGRVLPYKAARDKDEEKHCHPLQLDVIERCVLLWSNPDEVVFSPFMGVGSEVAGALMNGRKGLGIELKPSYFRQARRNIRAVLAATGDQPDLFGYLDDVGEDSEEMAAEIGR